jgi:tRNA G18 (ribose-2'-O)-methylase SpoU
MLRRYAARIDSLVLPEGSPEIEALRASHSVLVLAGPLFKEVDLLGTGPPLVVMRVEPPQPWDVASESRGLSLILPLGDPENVGAALRCAAAFAVDRVVLLEEAADPFTPRALRAAAGTAFDLELRAGPTLRQVVEAPPDGLEIVGLDPGGVALRELGEAPDAGRALLVGEEGGGLPAGDRILRASIPIAEGVESLNAAVAVGIALYELRRP